MYLREGFFFQARVVEITAFSLEYRDTGWDVRDVRLGWWAALDDGAGVGHRRSVY